MMRAPAHFGVLVAAAREHVLEDGFLLFAQAAGVDQVLARGEHLRVGARHFHLRERAFFHLGPHIGEQLLGQRDGLLLHLLVFVERHEIGVEADHAVDGQDELLLEEQAGDLLLVAGDADEAPVQAGAEAAQQRLRRRDARGWSRCKGCSRCAANSSDWRLLLKFSPTCAPLAKPCWIPALTAVVLVTSALDAGVTVLVCGVVWCVQFNCADHGRVVIGNRGAGRLRNGALQRRD